MELYVAIPRAITDIYWNGLPEKSEALGLFCVKSETKKEMLGKLRVTGFKEAITEEKIANRIYYGTEYGVEHEDIDCMIEKKAQIGDIVWEIVDKSTADKLLPPEELQKYMSLSAEEVHEQLQNIRTKARIIAQESRNLETESRFRNSNLNSNAIYIAIPKAITDIYWNELPKKSEALGLFCVKPETKKGMLGKLRVTGFKEAITEEKIANRIYYGTEYGIEHEDIDCMIEKKAQIGDIVWEIVDKSTADRLLPPEELQKYMSLSAEEVYEQLQNIRTKARIIAQESRNLETESRFRNSNLNSNAIYIAIPKAITDIYWNGLPKKSEALGLFCVKPETKKGMLGKLRVTGFKEAITEEKIANRIYYETEYGVEHEDIDFMVEKKAQIGDIIWEIVDKSTADRLLPPEELQKYMSLSAEEVHEQLQNIRTKARIIAQPSEKITGKKL